MESPDGGKTGDGKGLATIKKLIADPAKIKTIADPEAVPEGSSDRQYVNEWGKNEGINAAREHARRILKTDLDIALIEYEYRWVDKLNQDHTDDGSG
jgi:hypothetical protein